MALITFADWLEIGQENGWVSGVICESHDGSYEAMTEPERSAVEASEDDDPCIPMLFVRALFDVNKPLEAI